MFCYRCDVSLYSLVSAMETMMWPSSRGANIHYQLEVVPLISIRTVWVEIPAQNPCHICHTASRRRDSNHQRCGWESHPLPAQLSRPGTVLGCTVSHPIRSFHLWRDASWHNTFGGLGECYLCVHRHSAPATKPKHAGSDLGHQWIGLFFSFGEITLRHSHESFFSYFT